MCSCGRWHNCCKIRLPTNANGANLLFGLLQVAALISLRKHTVDRGD